MNKLNIGIIGYKFMGKAHSNAWKRVSDFFDVPYQPVLKAACGRNFENLNTFCKDWGWEDFETDWRVMIEREDIDVIDIAAPQNMHAEIAVAAARAGKHIFCEKPMAMNSLQAKEMVNACSGKSLVNYINHNYRRVPAISYAKKLIEEGELGEIYHWRSTYQQDWIIDPSFPLTWQLQKEIAQAGPQWDLNSHCVDLAHYLVGKITDVTALTKNFIKERPLADISQMGNLKATSIAGKGEVTVEDAALMLVNFENGAIGSFEGTRFANGRKNHLYFEIYGSEGALTFDLERLNELQFFSRRDPVGKQGFRKILVTEDIHPYMSNWWPSGHIIGYEHTFIHAVADFINAIHQQKPIHPNFEDGESVIKVLEAGLQSANEKRTINIK